MSENKWRVDESGRGIYVWTGVQGSEYICTDGMARVWDWNRRELFFFGSRADAEAALAAHLAPPAAPAMPELHHLWWMDHSRVWKALPIKLRKMNDGGMGATHRLRCYVSGSRPQLPRRPRLGPRRLTRPHPSRRQNSLGLRAEEREQQR